MCLWTHHLFSVIHTNDSAMLNGMPVDCTVEGQLVWHEFDFGGTVWQGWTAILAGCSDSMRAISTPLQQKMMGAAIGGQHLISL